LTNTEDKDKAITISVSDRIETHDIDEKGQTTPPGDMVLQQTLLGQFRGT
jgi:hypothetical protein